MYADIKDPSVSRRMSCKEPSTSFTTTQRKQVYTLPQIKESSWSFMVADPPLPNRQKSGLLNFTSVIDP
ncbi:hypothetical protein HPB50_014767 [Hyalomma asiaticum]|uniref:Uncharacterized protein n=1 Tax=Hyalomma asiaticum TaxID=266040 RepID=A0ACB7TGQ8_HYAAI|nr:hypothetical protein HPB50_014767 [Hyalomma asiaticum]